MKPHVRVLLFCLVILIAPFLFSMGERLGGLTLAVLLPAIAVVASYVHVRLGERRGRPST